MKFYFTAIFALLAGVAFAQNYDVKTYIFDLTPHKLDKGWRNFGGYVSPNGNYIIKYGQSGCNSSASSGFKIGSTVYQLNGTSYSFKELNFDKDFNFIDLKSKYFSNTPEALTYQNNLFGETFNPLPKNIFTDANLAVGFKAITSDFIGRRIVSTSPNMSLKVNYKICSAIVFSEVLGGINKQGSVYCGERASFGKIDCMKAAEIKGQVWAFLNSIEYPSGGVIAAATGGVVQETSKLNVSVKRYDSLLTELNSTMLKFDYYPVLQGFLVKNDKGYNDFVYIAQQSKNLSSPYLKEYTTLGKEYDKAELILLDGKTLEVKKRENFTMPYSFWIKIRIVQKESNNFYLIGTCATNKETKLSYSDLISAYPPVMDNFQMLKFSNNEIKWIKGYDKKGLAPVVSNILEIDPKGKPAKEVIITSDKIEGTTVDVNLKVYHDFKVYHDKIFINGQAGKKSHYLAVIDNNTGELTSYFTKGTDMPAKSDVVPVKNDLNKFYWTVYDYSRYDTKAGELFISTLDLKANKGSDFKLLGEKEWAVSYENPMVLNDINEDAFVLQGRLTTKKAKDSDAVLIKIKK
ncbi:MAG: hypothetical protein JSS93_07510 [Bacteroidetes bacterium]|nr:hypothetical protein [Bacteroidota bacterium]